MGTIFIKKISNKEGREVLKGEKVTKVIFEGKEYNLYGDMDNSKRVECYSSTSAGKFLGYLINTGKESIVTNETKKGFIIIK